MKFRITLFTLLVGGLGLLSSCTPVDEDALPIHTKGNDNAAVVVQEFSDFQCPYCAIHGATTVKKLIDEFGQDMRFEFRHYPLMRIHKQAELASIAAEAAGKQGKFWQMHDILYLNQSTWADNSNAKELFTNYANQLQLDVEQFKQDLGSNEIRATIGRDIRLGNSMGVNSTPSFYINGKKFEAQVDYYEELRAMIQTEINNAKMNTAPTEEPENTEES